ncbi:MAG: hypothetical protein P8182_10805 [Deltaproteobacteria bacterium]
MNSPKDPITESRASEPEPAGTSAKKIQVEDVLNDMRLGMRTKGFLAKYDISLGEFEQLLKQLIRGGHLSREEFRAWKAGGTAGDTKDEESTAGAGELPKTPISRLSNIETYVIPEPEKNHSWALELFSTNKERMPGAKFKVNLHGKKYAFVVEEMLFRGMVVMLAPQLRGDEGEKSKRDQAIEFISKHGWAAYLENRAFLANFEEDEVNIPKKARLALIRCRNDTFLAALHTPVPTINLYVSSSLEQVCNRLARSVDISGLPV